MKIFPWLLVLILATIIGFIAWRTGSGSDAIMSYASTNFRASYLNVAHQAESRHLTLFATTTSKPWSGHVDGHSLQVIVDDELIAKHEKWAGFYHNHHNGMVLNYVAAHRSDFPDLYNQVVEMMLEFTPDYEWSSPTHGNLTIEEIAEISADDHYFYGDEQTQWDWRLRDYQNSIENAP